MLQSKTLTDLVINWADSRKILSQGTTATQFTKLLEEYGELVAAVNRNNMDVAKDSIGDCLVVAIILRAMDGKEGDILGFVHPSIATGKYNVLISPAEHLGRLAYVLNRPNLLGERGHYIESFVQSIVDIAEMYELNPTECLNDAYNEIKGRQGVMRDGVFVKLSDLRLELDTLDWEIKKRLENGVDTTDLKLKADTLADLIVTIQREQNNE